VVAPEVPGGGPVGQAVLNDQADGPLLDAAGVQTLGHSQVGEVDGEAAAAAQAAMPGEGDNQVEGLLGSSVAEVMQGPRGQRVAAGAAGTARAAPSRVVAAAPFDARFREIFNAGDSLGNIRDILAWPVHRGNS
jgi:hypothetical protein